MSRSLALLALALPALLAALSGCAVTPRPVRVADAATGAEGAPPAATSAPAKSGGDGAAEMARKLQDPLANISGLMTDNDIQFNTGDDETTYQFMVQPVKAFPFEDEGFNFIARGVIPVMGVAGGGQVSEIGDPLPERSRRTWGLGDIVAQTFFSPRDDSAWKWGLGPQFALRTRTDSKLGGPGWGIGASGVIVGSLSENLSSSFIVGHLWGSDNSYSTSSVQPMLFYNIDAVPGMAVGYSAQITYNWDAKSKDALTLPLGLVVSRTFDVGGGHGLDFSIGPYWNVVRPDGAADWLIKFGINWILP